MVGRAVFCTDALNRAKHVVRAEPKPSVAGKGPDSNRPDWLSPALITDKADKLQRG